MVTVKRSYLAYLVLFIVAAMFFASTLAHAAPWGAHGEPPSKLYAAIQKELPKGMKLRLENFSARFLIPKSAGFSILSPHPPIGLINFEAHWPEGGFMKKVFGTVTVRASAQVVVAATPIRHGETITEENTSLEWRDINPFAATGYFMAQSKVVNLRANGYVRPGAVLGVGNTLAASAVRAGQAVDLVVEQGRLRIVAKVKALEAGQVKGWVRVENPSSKKILLARVTGPGEVTLK